MVPEAGVEPARYRYHRILSPARLPIPSFRRKDRYIVSQNQPAVKSFFHLAVLFLLQFGYSSGRVRENAWGLLVRSPQTPKNFQNVYIFMFGAALNGIFVIIILGEPALLLPEIAKTPSRGPLSPLYGGKGNALWGSR